MPEKSHNVEQQSEISQKVKSEFNKGNFGECTNLLNSVLASQKNRDSSVLHNLALVEFLNSGLTNIEGFKTKLKVIYNMDKISIDKTDKPFEPDFYLGCYHMAVINFLTQQYDDALKLLNQLGWHFKFIERDMAERIVLLLIETYIAIRRPDAALCVVTLLENACVKSASNDSNFEVRLLELKCKSILRLGGICEQELKFFEVNWEKAVEKVSYESEDCYNSRRQNVKSSARIMLSHMYYLRKDFTKCIQTLKDSSVPSNYELTGDSIPTILLNNIGCVYMRLKKPALASVHFSKSIAKFNEDSSRLPPSKFGRKDNKRPVFALGYSHEQLYNNGLALLYNNHPNEAFDCFTEVLQIYHMNPFLWYRLAECCIMAHKQGNDVDYDYKKKFELLKEVMINGKDKKLVLNLKLFENNKYSYDAQSFAIPVASLEFGTLCLRNALLLLGDDKVDYSPSYVTDVKKTNETLRAQTLVSSAYVALCVGDPLVCLQYTGCIFNLTNCPGIFMLSAHLYTAEAYVNLNKLDDALKHLQPDYCNYVVNRGQNDPSWNPLKPYKPQSAATVRITILFNMAVVCVLKHEFGKAYEILMEIKSTSTNQHAQLPIQALTLAVYLGIATGRNDLSINLIKQHCAHYLRKQLQKPND